MAALVALALLILGALVAVEIVTQVWRHKPLAIPYDHWYRSAVTNTWATASVRWLSLAVAAGGLLLLVVALVRRPPADIDLRDGEAVQADVQRSSLEKSLTRAAVSVDGVSDASVHVGPKSARVTARTTNHDPGDLDARVVAAVGARLGTVGLADELPVDVAVKRKEGR